MNLFRMKKKPTPKRRRRITMTTAAIAPPDMPEPRFAAPAATTFGLSLL
jgi:hypothetical protein